MIVHEPFNFWSALIETQSFYFLSLQETQRLRHRISPSNFTTIMLTPTESKPYWSFKGGHWSEEWPWLSLMPFWSEKGAESVATTTKGTSALAIVTKRSLCKGKSIQRSWVQRCLDCRIVSLLPRFSFFLVCRLSFLREQTAPESTWLRAVWCPLTQASNPPNIFPLFACSNRSKFLFSTRPFWILGKVQLLYLVVWSKALVNPT